MCELKEIRFSSVAPNVASYFSKIEQNDDNSIVFIKFYSDDKPKIENVRLAPRSYYSNGEMQLEATITRENKQIKYFLMLYRTSVNNYILTGYDAGKRELVKLNFESMQKVNDYLAVNVCENNLLKGKK